MRIALIIERMNISRGGRETSTSQIASELAHRSHDVTVVCGEGHWSNPGVRLLEVGDVGRPMRVQRLRSFVEGVRRAMDEQEFDVTHAMLPIPGADVYQPRGGTVPAQRDASFRRRGRLGRLFRKAVEPLNLHRRHMGELEQAVVSDSSVRCLAVSEMVAEEFRHYYGRSDGVRTVYNAVEVPDPTDRRRDKWRAAVRQKLNVNESAVVFVTIATNPELKGVGEAISAFAKWFRSEKQGPDARLVVVGRENPELFVSWAERCNVSGRVMFVPPTDNVFPWYAGADACILLSWYDPCSRVVLEATRWGIPSITTVYNGAAEVLSAGGGVVVASPRDIDGVVHAMAELADSESRRRHADACRRVAGELSITRHVDELLEVYAECASGGRVRKPR
ncbi:MAG: glycosyltransferase family 4 protein [Phycisphaerae bacterium]